MPTRTSDEDIFSTFVFILNLAIQKTPLLYETSACENNVQQIETELNQRESSIKSLLFHMRELVSKES